MSNAKKPEGKTMAQRRGELRSYAQTALAHPNHLKVAPKISKSVSGPYTIRVLWYRAA
jgi:hypothetical protein